MNIGPPWNDRLAEPLEDHLDGQQFIRFPPEFLQLRKVGLQRDTIVLLQGIAEEEGISSETQQTAAKVAAGLDKRAKTR